MALFGPFARLKSQTIDDRFAVALAYVTAVLRDGSDEQARIKRMAVGETQKIELTGGSFAMEQVYLPKMRPEGFFESHRRYIDVQVIVEGEELMEVEDIARLTVTQAYEAERDLIKYADASVASILRMRTGDAAIFFPEDGHMPSLHWRGTGPVRKTVVKVPVT